MNDEPGTTASEGTETEGTETRSRHEARRGLQRGPLSFRYSLAGLLTIISLIALASAYAITLSRLRSAETELARLRQETGYLAPTADDKIAAARLTSDQPMTYRLRVRVPKSPPYRITYSSVWPDSRTSPSWFGAVDVPPGESVVIVRILKDPRDERWKMTTLRRGLDGTRRIATILPQEHVEVFRGSHDWLRSGVSNETSTKPVGESLRLLDERVLVGEGAMMLYGDGPPADDMIGVFAELQPDIGAI